MTNVADPPVWQVFRASSVVALTLAVLVHGNRVLYFITAAARRAAAIAPALHRFAMAVSCCGHEELRLSTKLSDKTGDRHQQGY